MKFQQTLGAVFSVVVLGAGGYSIAADNTHSGQAARQASNASGNASGSAAHSVAASGQVTSAAIAIPLSVGAAVLGSGAIVSGVAADASMRAATAPIGTPLEITDESMTVVPPNQALRPTGNARTDQKN